MAENDEAKKIEPERNEDATEPPPKRVRLGSSEMKELSKDEIVTRWKDLNKYVDYLESKQSTQTSNSELAGLRESEEKLKHQQQESTRRENVLVMRLATKEHEMQELLTQIHDLKQAQNASSVQLRATLLDPAVNLLFQRMKTELDESKEKLEQAQNDLSAWKFTPDSVTGKKLMAKCRMLIQENQELGRQLSQGRVAQLEAELALQKKYSDELKTSQDELNDFVIQLDEEVEGMQSTILTLQQQLKDTKQQHAMSSELSEQLKRQLAHAEYRFQEARLQSLLDSGTHEDTQAQEQAPPEAEVQQTSENADIEASTVSDSQERILSPSEGAEKPRTGALSAFSISNLLATDSHKTEEPKVGHALERENGDQQEDPESGGGGGGGGALLEPSAPRLSAPKGLAEGIGESVSTLNGEVVG